MHLLARAAYALILASGGAMADETVVATDFLQMDWRLESMDGTRPGLVVTLNLGQPDRVFGQAPCNRYSAPLATEGPAFHVGAIVATRRACPDMALEAAFLAALQTVETAERSAGSLWLRGGGHQLHFVQPIN